MSLSALPPFRADEKYKKMNVSISNSENGLNFFFQVKVEFYFDDLLTARFPWFFVCAARKEMERGRID